MSPFGNILSLVILKCRIDFPYLPLLTDLYHDCTLACQPGQAHQPQTCHLVGKDSYNSYPVLDLLADALEAIRGWMRC
jgi:hypothetical protein